MQLAGMLVSRDLFLHRICFLQQGVIAEAEQDAGHVGDRPHAPESCDCLWLACSWAMVGKTVWHSSTPEWHPAQRRGAAVVMADSDEV